MLNSQSKQQNPLFKTPFSNSRPVVNNKHTQDNSFKYSFGGNRQQYQPSSSDQRETAKFNGQKMLTKPTLKTDETVNSTVPGILNEDWTDLLHEEDDQLENSQEQNFLTRKPTTQHNNSAPDDDSRFDKYTSKSKNSLRNSLLDEFIRGEFGDLQDQIDNLDSIEVRGDGNSSSFRQNEFQSNVRIDNLRELKPDFSKKKLGFDMERFNSKKKMKLLDDVDSVESDNEPNYTPRKDKINPPGDTPQFTHPAKQEKKDFLKISDLNFLADSGLSSDRNKDNFMLRGSNISSERSYVAQNTSKKGDLTPRKIQEFENFGLKNPEHEPIDSQQELRNFDNWWQKKTAVSHDHVSPQEKIQIDQMIDEGWKRKHLDGGAVINEFVLKRESEVMEKRQAQTKLEKMRSQKKLQKLDPQDSRNKLSSRRNKAKLDKQTPGAKQNTDYHSSGSKKISKGISLKNYIRESDSPHTMGKLNSESISHSEELDEFNLRLKTPHSALPVHPALSRESQRFSKGGQKDRNVRLMSSGKKKKEDYFEGFYEQNSNEVIQTKPFTEDLSWDQQVQAISKNKNSEKITFKKPEFLSASKAENTKPRKKSQKRVKKVKKKSVGKILGYFISGFDVNSEPDTIFKNLPNSESTKLKYDQDLSKEQVFHLKINEFKPQLLFQKCTDQKMRQILTEVVNYIFPNKIQGIYPFKLHSTVFNTETGNDLAISEEKIKESNGLEILDVDYLNQ